jgi:membrane fusion protein, multidrug efflux system
VRYRILFPLLVLGIGSAAAWHGWTGGGAQASLPAEASAPIPVDVASVTRRDVPVYLTGLGTVQALNTVTVTSRVDGQLQKVAFKEGQDVKAGDVLAQIDPRPFKATLDEAIAKKAQDQAQLKNSERDLQRFQTLYAKGFATNQQIATQQAQANQLKALVQGDQAAIANAETQLEYATITAPIAGRTGFRTVDEGNIVHATDTKAIVTITQVHPISVVFTVPEDDLLAVAQALSAGPVSATALSDDGTTELDHGKVSLIDNQIDQTTGTARLKAEFPNRDNLLWPGAFVSVRILARTERGALTVPSPAIQRGEAGPFVYVVKPDSTVETRPVKIKLDSGDLSLLDSDVRPGEQVVVDGQYRLQPGARVRAKEMPAGASPDSRSAASGESG